MAISNILGNSPQQRLFAGYENTTLRTSVLSHDRTFSRRLAGADPDATDLITKLSHAAKDGGSSGLYTLTGHRSAGAATPSSNVSYTSDITKKFSKAVGDCLYGVTAPESAEEVEEACETMAAALNSVESTKQPLTTKPTTYSESWPLKDILFPEEHASPEHRFLTTFGRNLRRSIVIRLDKSKLDTGVEGKEETIEGAEEGEETPALLSDPQHIIEAIDHPDTTLDIGQLGPGTQDAFKMHFEEIFQAYSRDPTWTEEERRAEESKGKYWKQLSDNGLTQDLKLLLELTENLVAHVIIHLTRQYVNLLRLETTDSNVREMRLLRERAANWSKCPVCKYTKIINALECATQETFSALDVMLKFPHLASKVQGRRRRELSRNGRPFEYAHGLTPGLDVVSHHLIQAVTGKTPSARLKDLTRELHNFSWRKGETSSTTWLRLRTTSSSMSSLEYGQFGDLITPRVEREMQSDPGFLMRIFAEAYRLPCTPAGEQRTGAEQARVDAMLRDLVSGGERTIADLGGCSGLDLSKESALAINQGLDDYLVRALAQFDDNELTFYSSTPATSRHRSKTGSRKSTRTYANAIMANMSNYVDDDLESDHDNSGDLATMPDGVAPRSQGKCNYCGSKEHDHPDCAPREWDKDRDQLGANSQILGNDFFIPFMTRMNRPCTKPSSRTIPFPEHKSITLSGSASRSNNRNSRNGTSSRRNDRNNRNERNNRNTRNNGRDRPPRNNNRRHDEVVQAVVAALKAQDTSSASSGRSSRSRTSKSGGSRRRAADNSSDTDSVPDLASCSESDSDTSDSE